MGQNVQMRTTAIFVYSFIMTVSCCTTCGGNLTNLWCWKPLKWSGVVIVLQVAVGSGRGSGPLIVVQHLLTLSVHAREGYRSRLSLSVC